MRTVYHQIRSLGLRGLGATVFCALALGLPSAFAAPPAGADAAADHGGGGLPQFDPSTYPSQVFWLLVMFVIMYVYFSRRILPEVSSVLENRQQHIQSDLDMAEKLKNEAAQAQQEYESLLTHARSESVRLMAETQEAIRARIEQESSRLQEKSAADIAALETSLANAKKQALAEMNKVIAELAGQAAQHIAGVTADPQQVQSVVETLSHQGKEAA